MDNWGFADGNGNEITRGWQGDDAQAKRKAQELADQRGGVVEYWVEGSGDDSEDERPSYVCQPQGVV